MVSLEKIRGLETFGEDYPEAQLIMLYQGTHRLKIRNVSCIPVEEFLLGLIPTKLLREIQDKGKNFDFLVTLTNDPA